MKSTEFKPYDDPSLVTKATNIDIGLTKNNNKEINSLHRSNSEIFQFPDITKQGLGKQTIRNVKHLLNYYSITLKYSLMKHESIMNIPNKTFLPERTAEDQLTYIIDLAITHGMSGDSRISNILDSIASENSFHEVDDYFKQLPAWDGINRIKPTSNPEEIKLLLSTTLNPVYPEIASTLLFRWLLSIPYAIYRDDITPRGILTIQGAETTGKSTWLSMIMPVKDAFMGEYILNLKDKDTVIEALRYSIVELAELKESVTRRNINAFKAFVTRKMDSVRVPYGRKNQRTSRRTVLCATVNPSEILVDPGQNTRFFIVEIKGRVNWNDINTFNMDQVWAQVLHEYENNESCYLSEAEQELLIKSNNAYREVSELEHAILDTYNFDGEWDKTNTGYWRSQKQVKKEIDWADSKSAKGLSEILKQLTGQSPTGSMKIHNNNELISGRFFKMPPLRSKF